jgi:predicted Zn-dependent protease
MRRALVLAGLGSLVAVTLLAIEPRPREEEPAPAEPGATGSGLPRPARLPAAADGLDPPEELFSQSPADRCHALGVATLAGSLKPAARDAAVDLLEQAVAADPAGRRYKLDLADAYMFLGDEVAVGMAIDLYEEFLDDEPEHDAVLGRLALAYLQMGNDEAAFSTLARRAAGAKANLRATALQLAATGLETGDLARAAQEVAKIADRRPDEPLVKLVLAMLRSDSGRRAEATELVDQLIADLPAGSPLADAARELKARIR